MTKHCKIEVEESRAEHEDKQARVASTIDYYGSIIVSFLIVFLNLLKFCKMSNICHFANLRILSLLFLAKFVTVRFTIVLWLN